MFKVIRAEVDFARLFDMRSGRTFFPNLILARLTDFFMLQTGLESHRNRAKNRCLRAFPGKSALFSKHHGVLVRMTNERDEN